LRHIVRRGEFVWMRLTSLLEQSKKLRGLLVAPSVLKIAERYPHIA
jgi:hypothetical protein